MTPMRTYQEMREEMQSTVVIIVECGLQMQMKTIRNNISIILNVGLWRASRPDEREEALKHGAGGLRHRMRHLYFFFGDLDRLLLCLRTASASLPGRSGARCKSLTKTVPVLYARIVLL